MPHAEQADGAGGFGPDQLVDEIAGAIRLGPSHMLGLFENLTKRYSVDRLKGDMVERVNLLLFMRPSSPILLPGQEPSTDAEEMREAEQTVRRLADLSPKITSEIRDVREDSAMAADFGVQELPVLLIAGRAKNRVRFVGTPRGSLFEGMLKAIWRASTGDDELPAEFVKDLGRVASDVYLRVFVSPTCPACKPVIDAALRMALTSSKVRADIIDATAFLDLADRFDIYGVPTTILNDRFSLGPVPEEMLLEAVIHASDPSYPAPQIPYVAYPSCGKL